MVWSVVSKLTSEALNGFWHFVGTIDRGNTIGALSFPIACFFVYLDIPFSDKAHRLSALLAYNRSYMPTMTMFALNSTASVSL